MLNTMTENKNDLTNILISFAEIMVTNTMLCYYDLKKKKNQNVNRVFAFVFHQHLT